MVKWPIQWLNRDRRHRSKWARRRLTNNKYSCRQEAGGFFNGIMSRSIDNRFYRTKAWRKCREAYIHKCGGLCERCFAKGILTPGYIVHHKTHLTEENLSDESLTYGFDNLEYLCKKCHEEEHESSKRFHDYNLERRKNGRKRYWIDDYGNLHIKEDK